MAKRQWAMTSIFTKTLPQIETDRKLSIQTEPYEWNLEKKSSPS